MREMIRELVQLVRDAAKDAVRRAAADVIARALEDSELMLAVSLRSYERAVLRLQKLNPALANARIVMPHQHYPSLVDEPEDYEVN
jgi:hypothetical protein